MSDQDPEVIDAMPVKTTQVRAPIQVGERGLELKTSDEMLRMASMMIQSKLVPSSFKTPQEVVVAMNMCREVGLPYSTGIQKMAVINGRAAMWGEAVRALVFASGKVKSFTERIEGEGDGRVCVMRCERNDIIGEIEIRYGVEHAKAAGLWKKAGPWTTSPEDMLSHKAFSRIAKRLFGDKMMGMDMVEEVQDYGPQERRIVSAAEDPLLTGLTAKDETNVVH